MHLNDETAQTLVQNLLEQIAALREENSNLTNTVDNMKWRSEDVEYYRTALQAKNEQFRAIEAENLALKAGIASRTYNDLHPSIVEFLDGEALRQNIGDPVLNKIPAIKEVRERFALGLREAKDHVDQYIADHTAN